MSEFFSVFRILIPPACVLVFLIASMVAVWRLEALARSGVEGSVLGTMVMPFFSGFGNIAFAVILASKTGDGEAVLTNCVFNNMANLTVMVGLPMLIWRMSSVPDPKAQSAVCELKISRWTTEFELLAMFVFTLFLWLLSFDGSLSREDGWSLILLFAFWLCFRIYDASKTNLLREKVFPKTLFCDFWILILCAAVIYFSIEYLVGWFHSLNPVLMPPRFLGWLSGVLMVLPNGLLALYYGYHRRMDIVYDSQVGDAHICIPLCVGLFVMIHPFEVGGFLLRSLLILMGLLVSHLIFIVITPRFSRVFAAIFIAVFCVFVWLGLFS